MRYACYNDYELLYLVKEGSQRALDILYHKYTVFVCSRVRKYIINSDKRNDMIQEGLMVVDKCIKNYDPNSPISLFWYISLSISRKYSKLINEDYYRSKIIFSDNEIAYSSSDDMQHNKSFLLRAEYFFTDPIDILIYNENLLDGTPLLKLSEKYNISYYEMRKRRIIMLEELKKILTNYGK